MNGYYSSIDNMCTWPDVFFLSERSGRCTSERLRSDNRSIGDWCARSTANLLTEDSSRGWTRERLRAIHRIIGGWYTWSTAFILSERSGWRGTCFKRGRQLHRAVCDWYARAATFICSQSCSRYSKIITPGPEKCW